MRSPRRILPHLIVILGLSLAAVLHARAQALEPLTASPAQRGRPVPLYGMLEIGTTQRLGDLCIFSRWVQPMFSAHGFTAGLGVKLGRHWRLGAGMAYDRVFPGHTLAVYGEFRHLIFKRATTPYWGFAAGYGMQSVRDVNRWTHTPGIGGEGSYLNLFCGYRFSIHPKWALLTGAGLRVLHYGRVDYGDFLGFYRVRYVGLNVRVGIEFGSAEKGRQKMASADKK